jgi:hypothetical protein
MHDNNWESDRRNGKTRLSSSWKTNHRRQSKALTKRCAGFSSWIFHTQSQLFFSTSFEPHWSKIQSSVSILQRPVVAAVPTPIKSVGRESIHSFSFFQWYHSFVTFWSFSLTYWSFTRWYSFPVKALVGFFLVSEVSGFRRGSAAPWLSYCCSFFIGLEKNDTFWSDIIKWHGLSRG